MWVLASASLWGAVTHREWVANRMDMPVAVFAAAVLQYIIAKLEASE